VNHKGEDQKIFLLRIAVIIFLLIGLVAGGCEPLRKKFIRQKKKDKEQSLGADPVLEPLEYPPKVYSSEELYRKHYSLWQAWHTDLLAAIDDEGSLKRQLYDLGQAMVQLEEIKKLLLPGHQQKLQSLLDELEGVRAQMKKPLPLINVNALRRQLESVGKKIRRDYQFLKIKDSLAKE